VRWWADTDGRKGSEPVYQRLRGLVAACPWRSLQGSKEAVHARKKTGPLFPSLARFRGCARDGEVEEIQQTEIIAHGGDHDPCKRAIGVGTIAGSGSGALGKEIQGRLSAHRLTGTHENSSALVKNVCKDIKEGYNWWWTPDVKSCFPSIRPSHFRGIPIDRRIMMNVIFLPKCAKVQVAKSGHPGNILKWLDPSLSELPVGYAYKMLSLLTVQIVRRGLLQGSVVTPLLARAVVGGVLKSAVSDMDLKTYSYIDDLSVGAQTKGKIKAAQQIVTEAFASLPAGKIELHDTSPKPASSWRVEVLGYFLEPGNGYGDRLVHVKPGPKRIKGFKAGLKRRLEQVPPDAAYELGNAYWKRWFGSQQAWTKVPFCSAELSWCASMEYVGDFLLGIPLGTTHLNEPPLNGVGK
jgi:hypothetical protein